ncbi:MAG: CoA-transferase subunit beta [Acidimicrobiia bacterium]
MTVAAARALRNGQVCFVGIGLPSTAANLALRTHAPNLVLIYESGPIRARPDRLPLSIGDGVLAESASLVVSVPEMFNYWLQSGRIGLGFLGAAQIDRFANINTTVIGHDYHHPKVRLPGAGGAPEIAASCGEVIVSVRQSRRTFVERVDFVTSVGFGDGSGAREHRRSGSWQSFKLCSRGNDERHGNATLSRCLRSSRRRIGRPGTGPNRARCPSSRAVWWPGARRRGFGRRSARRWGR